MRLHLIAVVAVAALVLGATGAVAQGVRVSVEGLFPGSAAVISIDGKRKMLKVGQTFEGVTLVAADGNAATLEIDGKRSVLGLSQHIGSTFAGPEQEVVTIARNNLLQYQTTAEINGRSVRVLVDTGANVVALSSHHAGEIGLDYRANPSTVVQTAGGVVDAHAVTLRSVSVGGIRVDNVEATVVEGGYPNTILLGMTYLRHLSIKEENGILSLSRAR